MSRLIDADALVKLMCRACNNECCEEPCEPGECFMYDAISNAPTVDAETLYSKLCDLEIEIGKTSGVEIVRCKDCKYQIKEWHSDNRMISKGYYTYGCDRNFHRYSSNAVNGQDNEFCSHGERRTDV